MLLTLPTPALCVLMLVAAPCQSGDLADEFVPSAPLVQATPAADLDDSITLVNGQNTPPPEVIRQRYPNGAVQTIKHVIQDEAGNFINHGPWTMLDPKGVPVIEGVLDHGTKQGHWTRIVDREAQQQLLSENPGFQAPLRSDVSFLDGEMHGAWTMQDFRGRTLFRIAMKHGLRDGESVWFHSNGQQKTLITYQEGVANGVFRQWDVNGGLSVDVVNIDGRQTEVRTDYHDPPTNRLKKSEEHILTRRYTTKAHDDWWNSQMAEYEVSGAEVVHGLSVAWHANGKMRRQVEYRWGERHGYATWWYENGQVKTQGKFVNGREEGEWTWWHETGGKKAEGMFENGRPTQTWRAWRDNGVLQGKLVDPYLKLSGSEFSVLKLVRADRLDRFAPMIADYADPAPPLPAEHHPNDAAPTAGRTLVRETLERAGQPGERLTEAIELSAPVIVR